MKWTCAAAAVVSVAAAFADTVKTNDNNSANGRIVTLDGEKLVMKARFVGEEREIEVPRSRIKTVEFNNNTFNPNAPRGPFFARSPHAASPKQNEPDSDKGAPAGPHDIVFLKSGGQREAYVIGIDEKSVHLRGGQLVDRYMVQSIRFAREQ